MATESVHCNNRLLAATAIYDCLHSQWLPAAIVAGYTQSGQIQSNKLELIYAKQHATFMNMFHVPPWLPGFFSFPTLYMLYSLPSTAGNLVFLHKCSSNENDALGSYSISIHPSSHYSLGVACVRKKKNILISLYTMKRYTYGYIYYLNCI